MRRSVLAIIGTVAGTALLVGAKLGTPAPADPAAAALDAAASGDAGNGAPSTSPAAPVPTGTAAAPKPGSTGKPAPPPTTPAAGGLKTGTFTGAGAAARNYETVTVTITVSGGKVTVATGSCGNASGESKSICQGAMPKLQQETLSAQNAKIATVSGATYTSGAYRSSLQSALDRAKA
jgi:uncharacterized protein with FMN-binding domain